MCVLFADSAFIVPAFEGVSLLFFCSADLKHCLASLFERASLQSQVLLLAMEVLGLLLYLSSSAGTRILPYPIGEIRLRMRLHIAALLRCFSWAFFVLSSPCP